MQNLQMNLFGSKLNTAQFYELTLRGPHLRKLNFMFEV